MEMVQPAQLSNVPTSTQDQVDVVSRLQEAVEEERQRRLKANGALFALQGRVGRDDDERDSLRRQLVELQTHFDALQAAHQLARQETEVNVSLSEELRQELLAALFERDCARGDAEELTTQLRDRETALQAVSNDRTAAELRAQQLSHELQLAQEQKQKLAPVATQLRLQKHVENSASQTDDAFANDQMRAHSSAASRENTGPGYQADAGAYAEIVRLQAEAARLRSDLSAAVGYGSALRDRVRVLESISAPRKTRAWTGSNSSAATHAH